MNRLAINFKNLLPGGNHPPVKSIKGMFMYIYQQLKKIKDLNLLNSMRPSWS
jgi:hypothetical protein